MKAKPYFSIIRAVGSEYIVQMLRPFAIGLAIVLSAIIVLATWLTTINAWYWLLNGLVFILLVITLVVCTLVLLAVRILRPDMSPEQQLAVRNFTGKLQQVTEDVRTPWPWIIAKVLRDVVLPTQNGFLPRIIDSSKTLYPDFRTLQELFAASDDVKS